jgi:transposase-like protein
MSKDNVIELKKPETFIDDPITELVRKGAREILSQALEIEINSFLSFYAGLKDAQGRQRITRNGYKPERDILTGIGPISVKVPRARDRQNGASSERIRFTSSIVPAYLKKTKSMEALIPWLYLKGISTGNFTEALAAIVGRDAPGLTVSTISRLKSIWEKEYQQWQARDLSGKHYVYIWADGVYCNVRMDDKQCMLVIIGATRDGKKELLAIEGGFRESEQSWMSLLNDLKRRGLEKAPALAIGDGSLGFWKAISKAYETTEWQRCWVHKTANVLNKLPKTLQKRAKEDIHKIWMAETLKDADASFDSFINTYEAKYPKAVNCLVKDRASLLKFYDYPAEHWRHIRTTNPIESTFATVKLRTAKVRGCFSSTSVLSMAFKLCKSAEERWIKLHHHERLGQLIEGIKFVDGIKQERTAA